MKNQENRNIISNITFPTQENHQWKTLTDKEIFSNKKIIIFGLPGAFTPTCSSSHLPRYEFLYDTFIKEGIDEIYCVSVNDAFVMQSWFKNQKIHNVKILADGNGTFTKNIDMLVNKSDIGFGQRSWRYSMLIDNGIVKKHFIEPDKEGDPFEISDADTMLKFINENTDKPQNITIFTKEDCPFCFKAKKILSSKNMIYTEIILEDNLRQQALLGLLGTDKPTVPQIFINGQHIDGYESLKKHLQ